MIDNHSMKKRHFHALLKSAIPLTDHFVAPNAAIISNEQQAITQINHSGQIIFFGDQHGYSPGHEAVIDLLPTLAKVGVKTLAIEMPFFMNDFLKGLQDTLKAKNLTDETEKNLAVDQTYRQIASEMKRLKLSNIEEMGGEQRVKDFAKIITEASQHGIQVVGIDIDPRTNLENQSKLLLALQKDKAGDPSGVLDAMAARMPSDIITAVHLQNLMEQNPAGKIAVMYGIGHSCRDTKYTNLMQHLTNSGLSVTAISVTSPEIKKIAMPTGACPIPTSIEINATGLHADILQHKKPPKTSAPPLHQ